MGCALSADGRRLTLTGPLTEQVDFSALPERLDGDVRVDASGISRITSAGVVEWVAFITHLPASARLRFEACSVAFVNQLNTVRSFIGDGRVESICVPYLCPGCGASEEPVMNLEQLEAGLPLTRGPCATCGASLELDVPPDDYLAFLARELGEPLI